MRKDNHTGYGSMCGRCVCNLSPWEAERPENYCKFEVNLGYTGRPHLRWETRESRISNRCLGFFGGAGSEMG